VQRLVAAARIKSFFTYGKDGADKVIRPLKKS